MARRPLASDTPQAIEQIQIERWHRMSPAEKAAIISGLSRAAREMAIAGVRHRYPDASPREQFLRLAVVNLGADLARKAYPEIELLDLP